jgi:hypothetical protein
VAQPLHADKINAPLTGDFAMPENDDIELRDWFAGRALEGLLAGVNAPKKSKSETAEQYAARCAEEAYLFSDAMMQRRNTPLTAGEPTP